MLDASHNSGHPRAMAGRRRKASSVITIREVAAAAGVSTMTVSRVINDDPNVRDTTRARVRTAMTDLSYTPNAAAQSLAGADRILIGLLYSNPSASYLSEFLLGGLDQVSRSNVGLFVEKCDGGGDECTAARRLLDDRVDGIILPPPLCDDADLVAMLDASGVPTVAVGTGQPRAPMSAVSIDDRGAAQEITAHLIGLGHRRIGLITGNDRTAASGERTAGYRAALAAAHIAPDDALIAPGSFTYRSGLAGAEALLALADPPTAIFASNDDMAAATISTAHRRGLDVPGDLSVVGFDDTQIATTVWPEMTTVNQPIAAMSRAAVELLVDEIRAARTGTPLPPRQLQLAHSLVVRDSATPPRA